MAEIIGTAASVLTLASLFKTCLDAFDLIETAQNQEIDLKKLTLKLNIEKCRLYMWGKAMGMTGDREVQPRLSDSLQVSVLFVCFGNVCRSTMADAIFRSLTRSDPRVGTVDSAGIYTNATDPLPHPFTLSVLRRHGIHGYSHPSRSVISEDFRNFDFILAVNTSVLRQLLITQRRIEQQGTTTKAQVMLLGRFNNRMVAEEVHDPYSGTEADFERIYAQLLRLSTVFLHRLPLKIGAYQIEGLVRDTLEMIIQLFTDTQQLRDRYGCEAVTFSNRDGLLVPNSGVFRPLSHLAVSFSHYKINSPLSEQARWLARKTRWVVRDKKKFVSLVAEIKDFVNGLQKITKLVSTVAEQQTSMRLRISRIGDPDTLNIVSQVCKNDHPGISDAASERSDLLSTNNADTRNIRRWSSNVWSETNVVTSGIEDLTLTELKHLLLAYMQKRKGLKGADIDLSDLGDLYHVLDEPGHEQLPSCDQIDSPLLNGQKDPATIGLGLPSVARGSSHTRVTRDSMAYDGDLLLLERAWKLSRMAETMSIDLRDSSDATAKDYFCFRARFNTLDEERQQSSRGLVMKAQLHAMRMCLSSAYREPIDGDW